jgi:8-oxo-dGTP diphosphatase
MESNITNYVCGFYFDSTFEQVVLIWKNKPSWQKGKLNGVGGKIEKGEPPLNAMRREFHEEAGILHNEWVDLIILTGTDWRVYFFCAIGKVNEFEYAETKEDEEVAKIEINRLLANEYAHIQNLEWLVPMAIQRLQFPLELMSFSDNYATLQAKCDRYEAALKEVEVICKYLRLNSPPEIFQQVIRAHHVCNEALSAGGGEKEVAPKQIEYMPIHPEDARKPYCPRQIPMSLLNEERAQRNHGQTLQRLKERGGLGVLEILSIIQDKSWSNYKGVKWEEALKMLNDILNQKEDKQ